MPIYKFKWERVYARSLAEGKGEVQIASGDIRMAVAAAQLQVAEIHALSPNQVKIRDIQRVRL